MITVPLDPMTTAELWAFLRRLIESGVSEDADIVKGLGLEIYERLEGLKG